MNKNFALNVFETYDLLDLIDRHTYRPLQESKGYLYKKDNDGNNCIVANVVGLSEKDIEVKVDGYLLTLRGEKTNRGMKYSTSLSWYLKDIYNDIDRVEWAVEDGMAYITIIQKKKNEIPVVAKQK